MSIFKTTKINYYIKNYFLFYTAKRYKNKASEKINLIHNHPDKAYIKERVDYYNKLQNPFSIDDQWENITLFHKTHKKNAYFFDTILHLKYFKWMHKIKYAFGDVTYIPKTPSFVKSRPICDDNENSILLKLDKIRHFHFIKDHQKFDDKKNILVWRGDSRNRPHRVKLLQKLWNHPMCDIGQTQDPIEDVPWQKGKLTIEEQLRCKFILCIEGFDVATNLKWAMSSNSLVFSYPLKYETWYMEGTLIENHHFVVIKEDLSDLEEKLNYYIDHPNEAKKIIKNANDYIVQFKDKKREDLISLLVIEKYFNFQKEKE